MKNYGTRIKKKKKKSLIARMCVYIYIYKRRQITCIARQYHYSYYKIDSKNQKVITKYTVVDIRNQKFVNYGGHYKYGQ